MIVLARTLRALGWAGRFGVLGLAALALPIAPTWGQESRTPGLDGVRDALAVHVDSDRDTRSNLDFEMDEDYQLRDQVAQGFRRDAQVASLVEQIKATMEVLAHTKGVAGKVTGPTRVAAKQRLAELNAQYAILWRTKSEVIQERLIVSGEAFERGLFGRVGNTAAARDRLNVLLQLKIHEIDPTRHMTIAQKEKLRLAGRGDIKRFFDQVERKRTEFALLTADPVKCSQFIQELQPLRRRFAFGPFGEGSIFTKTLKRMAADDQVAGPRQR
jgi:hypothetical protein